ncbi:hypothetical protein AYR62_13150 [Secundilactobacillus paracollinoides]|uniref:Uncharacterized protein n=1 Tax=Secundilactobacillus paracollinoides TaxID=240427 RepID=A0A1B2IWM0_9LACO|nr:hypothetical protein [Secundilactobacillus paracollinoides]ANZ60562.1 hypothetical protein AYR61_03850 [Secundilactobacillus paracollinoides]ANZ64927.1 hypothetical protein AYR62_13150 [Secundilactobacillus paracollinoides]ANZ66445.1 hypothetical protein AYR63_04380 [Secundilactobacillus paracollinoides]
MVIIGDKHEHKRLLARMRDLNTDVDPQSDPFNSAANQAELKRRFEEMKRNENEIERHRLIENDD